MTHYDLVIIGAGSGNMLPPGGFPDWRVALIESDRFGGTCLNRGCIPSKMFAYTADVAGHVRNAHAFGIEAEIHDVDWPAIRDRVFSAIDPLHEKAVSYRREHGVDVHLGEVRFVGHKTLEVNGEQLTADRIVVGTGSTPVVPEWPGIDSVPFHTSDTIMRLDSLPATMTIVGGGYIAVEMAHIFGALGTNVTMLVRGNTLLSKHDESISSRFTEVFSAQRDIRFSSDVQAILQSGNGIRVDYVGQNGSQHIESEVLLVATGRRPNTDALKVAASDIATNDDGSLARDETGETSVPGVWTFGDVSSHYQLKHVANAEVRTVWHNVANPGSQRSLALPVVPQAVFTDPQVATVGATEQELRDNGTDYVCAYRSFSATAYGWALQDETSFAKVLVDSKTQLLLGAHIVGHEAAILIQPLVQAMGLGTTVEELCDKVLYPHPALSEIIEQVLLKP